MKNGVEVEGSRRGRQLGFVAFGLVTVAVLVVAAVLVWGLPWTEGTGDREVSGSEAPVGEGRLTRLTSGPVTVVVPPDSVDGPGEVRIGPTGAAAPDGFVLAGPSVDVSLEGTSLVGPITMEIAVEGGSEQLLQVSQDTGTGEWKVDDGVWEPESGRLISTVTHLSPKLVVRLPDGVIKGLVEALVGEQLLSQFGDVAPPTCTPQDWPATEGWAANSSTDPRTMWCLTDTGGGGRSLTIRNGRRYGVVVDIPAALPATRPPMSIAVTSFFKWLGEQGSADGRQLLVLERGGDAIIDLSPIQVNQNGIIEVRFDSFGWMVDTVGLAATSLATIVARVPTWAVGGQIKKFADAKAFLDSASLVECVAGKLTTDSLTLTDPAVIGRSIGGVLGCMIDLVKEFGGPAWLIAAMSTAVSTVGTLLAAGGTATVALVDQLRGEAYRVRVARVDPDPCALIPAALGSGETQAAVVEGLCDGSWALVDTCPDCGGDTLVIALRAASEWQARFAFPSDECESDARRAGVPESIVQRINWPPCEAASPEPAGPPSSPSADCDPDSEGRRLREILSGEFAGSDSWAEAADFETVARPLIEELAERCGSEGAFAAIDATDLVGGTYRALTGFING